MHHGAGLFDFPNPREPRQNRNMTPSNPAPATRSTARKSLTLLQFLSLIAIAGVASSLLIRQFL